jgi:hypothetical protein
MFLRRPAERRDAEGYQVVIRKGYLPEREVLSRINRL